MPDSHSREYSRELFAQSGFSPGVHTAANANVRANNLRERSLSFALSKTFCANSWRINRNSDEKFTYLLQRHRK